MKMQRDITISFGKNFRKKLVTKNIDDTKLIIPSIFFPLFDIVIFIISLFKIFFNRIIFSNRFKFYNFGFSF